MKMKLFALLTLLSTTQIIPKHVLTGKPAPLFSSKAVFPDGKVKTFDLKNYIGQTLVLYFYPMDNTPGCTKQAKIFRDNMTRLNNAGITIVGISCDSIKSHLNFQKKYLLPYILVSDSRKKRTICKAYDTSTFLMSKRKTFLVNKQGIIFKVFEHIDLEQQIDDILQAFATQK